VYTGSAVTRDVSLQAALETQGEVLTYRGELADAYYFSSSGGHTADNDLVWNGTPVPYLRGVPDPYDSVSPDHTWQTSASRATVLNALSRRFGGRVEGIVIQRRSRSGRILEMELIGGTRSISGAQFRQVLNATAGARTIRSARFDVSIEGDQYVFRGGGYGHGVGMSQYGALGQARAGRTYRDILAYYFAGTEVGRPGGLPAPVLVASTRPAEAGTPAAAVPREPSALRTRYRPATARRWPTPRHIARQQEAASPARPATFTEPPDATPAAPGRPAAEPATTRRTAW
jgi:stage II sporulation protein D